MTPGPARAFEDSTLRRRDGPYSPYCHHRLNRSERTTQTSFARRLVATAVAGSLLLATLDRAGLAQRLHERGVSVDELPGAARALEHAARRAVARATQAEPQWLAPAQSTLAATGG